MNFATWSIRNPVPSILLFILMTLAGWMGFKNLGIQSFPDMDLPTVTVAITLPGAVPSQLETEVARKVENTIATLASVRHIRTSITDGLVTITVEFELEKPLSDALIETKDAVDGIKSDLPAAIYPPTVSAARTGGDPLVTYAITSQHMNEGELSWFVDDTISKALLVVPGLGRFERLGGVNREVRVNVDPVNLAGLGVTALDISQALQLNQVESSGGRAQIGQSEQSVRTVGTVKQASELNAMPIATASGRKVRLDQVATVTDGYAERTQAGLLDGKPTVGFRFYRTKGFDETKIAAGAQKVLDALRVAHPDLTITLVNNTVDYTLDQYHGSMDMLYEGALLAVIVVWVFLRDWRATLIAATALPLSIIPTFAMMHWLDYSLNTLTLLALAVVVGILVDDAIVEIENIVRHKRMGKSIREAAEEAVNEIALAVMATTLTLVVVFLPTSLMGGIPGMIFREFGWTIVISVLVSLVVARLLTPVLAVYFLKSDERPEGTDGWAMEVYLDVVQWCLKHRVLTLLPAVAFFVGSIYLAKLIPLAFIPASDRGYTVISFELPPGSSLHDSLATAEAARLSFADLPGIAHTFTLVGDAQKAGIDATQAGEVRKGTLTLSFLPRGSRPGATELVNSIRSCLANIPGARFTLSSGGPGEQLVVILASDNETALTSSTQEVVREMHGITGLGNISSTASLQKPEIIIRPDLERAAELGVTTQTIGDTVRIATAGDFDPQLSRLDLDNRQIYIRVSFPDSARQDINTISSLRIPTLGGLTSLATIADITNGTGPSEIDRYDRQRYVTVNADLGGEPLGQALAATKALPAIKNLPSPVRLIDSGDAEMMAEIFSGFGLAMLTSVFCVFCVLVLLFNDFFQPITILCALPLSIGGAILALLLTHEQMGIPSLIGMIMLIGIVTKNSILLVEYTVVGMRDRHLSCEAAILDACHKRARPIIMTSIAMIAGMMPIALGLGGDASFRQPMAIAVIGGLITSTALSLLVVPVTYSLVNGFESWCRALFSKHPELIIAPIGEEASRRKMAVSAGK